MESSPLQYGVSEGQRDRGTRRWRSIQFYLDVPENALGLYDLKVTFTDPEGNTFTNYQMTDALNVVKVELLDNAGNPLDFLLAESAETLYNVYDQSGAYDGKQFTVRVTDEMADGASIDVKLKSIDTEHMGWVKKSRDITLESSGADTFTSDPVVFYDDTVPDVVTYFDGILTMMPVSMARLEYSGAVVEKSVLKIDLDVVTPGGREVGEDKEDTDGGVVGVNIDDDDGDGGGTLPVPDWLDTDGVSGENDLLTLRIHPVGVSDFGGKFYLVYDDTRIRLWKDAEKSDSITSDVTSFTATQQTDVYLEGIASSADMDGEVIRLDLYDKDKTTGKLVGSDSVKIVVAQMVFVIQADMPKWQTANLDLGADKLYAHPDQKLYVIRRDGSGAANKCFAVFVWATEEGCRRALSAADALGEGGYVSIDGHGNFGIGPNFGQYKTRISEFTNLGESLAAIDWPYLSISSGAHVAHHPGLSIPYSDYAGSAAENYAVFEGGSSVTGSRLSFWDTVYSPSTAAGATYALHSGPDPVSQRDDYHFLFDNDPNEPRLVVNAGAADMPTKRWKKIILSMCWSGDYFLSQFQRGTVFYNDDFITKPFPVEKFVLGVMEGLSDAEILAEIRAAVEGDPEPELGWDYKSFGGP